MRSRKARSTGVSLSQFRRSEAAKARARGYRNKDKMITIVYLTAAKLPLPTVTNPTPVYIA